MVTNYSKSYMRKTRYFPHILSDFFHQVIVQGQSSIVLLHSFLFKIRQINKKKSPIKSLLVKIILSWVNTVMVVYVLRLKVLLICGHKKCRNKSCKSKPQSTLVLHPTKNVNSTRKKNFAYTFRSFWFVPHNHFVHIKRVTSYFFFHFGLHEKFERNIAIHPHIQQQQHLNTINSSCSWVFFHLIRKLYPSCQNNNKIRISYMLSIHYD